MATVSNSTVNMWIMQFTLNSARLTCVVHKDQVPCRSANLSGKGKEERVMTVAAKGGRSVQREKSFGRAVVGLPWNAMCVLVE